MSAKRDPDTILAAWLVEGPTRLPDATRRAIAVGIRSTRQARGWLVPPAWRNHMIRVQLAGLAVVAIVAFGGVVVLATLTRPSGGVGAPSLSPSASPAPSSSTAATPEPRTFASARHGYSIAYPEGWTVVPARNPWPYGSDLEGLAGAPTADAAIDVFTPPLGPMASRIVAASQLLPAGMSATGWRDDYFKGFSTSVRDICVPSPDKWTHLTVDGVDIASYRGCDWIEAMGFTGGRAYLFRLENALNTTSIAVFDQMLKTITFHPGNADDTPIASPAPSPSASSSP